MGGVVFGGSVKGGGAMRDENEGDDCARATSVAATPDMAAPIGTTGSDRLACQTKLQRAQRTCRGPFANAVAGIR